MLKKAIAFIMCLGILISTVPAHAAPATPFTDLPEGTKHYDSVMELVNDGVISGYSDGTFKPNNNITIREALIIVEKTFGNANNLPAWNEWEELKSTGMVYQTNWDLDCTLFRNDYFGAVTYEIGSHFVLDINRAEIVDPLVYGYAPEHPYLLGLEYFNNVKLRGFVSDKRAHNMMTRGEFCDLVVWAKTNINNKPTRRVSFPITYSLLNGKPMSPDERTTYESHFLGAFMQAPKWVLNYYARNNGTIKIVQDSEWTHDPHAAAVYSHSGSSPVIYTRSTDAQSAIHELGHFVYDASNVSFPDAIFNAEKDKLTIVTWSDYCKTNKSEYFAEAFWAYCLFPAGVEKHAPQTYAFLNELCTKLEAEYK